MVCHGRRAARVNLTTASSRMTAPQKVASRTMLASRTEMPPGEEFERERDACGERQRASDGLRQRPAERNQRSSGGGGGKQGFGCQCRGEGRNETRAADPQARRIGRRHEPAPGRRLLADQQPGAQHSQCVSRHQQRMQQSAMEGCRARGHGCIHRCQGEQHQRQPRRPHHANRHRNVRPAQAMATPAPRTPMRPVGQRTARPSAMPARCSRPVATTKPRE